MIENSGSRAPAMGRWQSHVLPNTPSCAANHHTNNTFGRLSACGGVGIGRAIVMSDFCALAAGRSLVELSTDERSDSRDLAGKRALDHPRSRSSDAGGDAVAMSWNADWGGDLMAAESIPVLVGISKSGASFFATDVLTASKKPLPGRSHEPR